MYVVILYNRYVIICRIIEMRYSVWGISYASACSLIEELIAYGIQANVTVGGIGIELDHPIEFDRMNQLCRKYHTVAVSGETLT